MRGVLGILLIGVGLVGTYLVLSGKFPPGQGGTVPVDPNNPQNIPNYGAPVYGQTDGSNNTAINIPSQTGSGSESIQSAWTQLGHVLAIHPLDRNASRGGFR